MSGVRLHYNGLQPRAPLFFSCSMSCSFVHGGQCIEPNSDLNPFTFYSEINGRKRIGRWRKCGIYRHRSAPSLLQNCGCFSTPHPPMPITLIGCECEAARGGPTRETQQLFPKTDCWNSTRSLCPELSPLLPPVKIQKRLHKAQRNSVHGVPMQCELAVHILMYHSLYQRLLSGACGGYCGPSFCLEVYFSLTSLLLHILTGCGPLRAAQAGIGAQNPLPPH